MAEKDLTGQATDVAAEIVRGAFGELRKMVPYGPSREKLSTRQMRARWVQMAPQERYEWMKGQGWSTDQMIDFGMKMDGVL